MSIAPKVMAIRAVGILVMMATIVTAAATPAAAAEPKQCTPVRLSGVGQDLGLDASGNDHTQATLSLLGLAIGTTNATFTFARAPVGSSQAFTGPIVFTPRVGRASLTAQVTGVVDLNTGKFKASSTAISGIGALAAVSGHVTIRGLETLTTGAFTETVTGRLCLPIAVRSGVRSSV